MKIDELLLTDKEINNIEIRNKAYEVISKRIDEESEKIREEEFGKFNKDEDELDRSYLIMYNLRIIYANYESVYIMLLFGIASLSFVFYMATFNTVIVFDKSMIYSFMFIIGTLSSVWSIKGLLIRYKIKSNFKKYNILNDL